EPSGKLGEKAIIFDIQDFTLHDGPGVRSTIFLKGCPLECGWCCNPESQKPYPQYMVNYDICQQCRTCEALGATFESGYPSFPNNNKAKSQENVCPNGALRICGKPWTADELFDHIKSKVHFYQDSNGGITLSGGEPLLYYNFVNEFVWLVKAYGINVGIETCGCWDYNNPTIQN